MIDNQKASFSFFILLLLLMGRSGGGGRSGGRSSSGSRSSGRSSGGSRSFGGSSRSSSSRSSTSFGSSWGRSNRSTNVVVVGGSSGHYSSGPRYSSGGYSGGAAGSPLGCLMVCLFIAGLIMTIIGAGLGKHDVFLIGHSTYSLRNIGGSTFSIKSQTGATGGQVFKCPQIAGWNAYMPAYSRDYPISLGRYDIYKPYKSWAWNLNEGSHIVINNFKGATYHSQLDFWLLRGHDDWNSWKDGGSPNAIIYSSTTQGGNFVSHTATRDDFYYAVWENNGEYASWTIQVDFVLRVHDLSGCEVVCSDASDCSVKRLSHEDVILVAPKENTSLVEYFVSSGTHPVMLIGIVLMVASGLGCAFTCISSKFGKSFNPDQKADDRANNASGISPVVPSPVAPMSAPGMNHMPVPPQAPIMDPSMGMGMPQQPPMMNSSMGMGMPQQAPMMDPSMGMYNSGMNAGMPMLVGGHSQPHMMQQPQVPIGGQGPQTDKSGTPMYL
ncbi:hypothetical protein RCL1_001901 [Eukaryota sp. TZLM3-RCL]